MKKYEFVSVSCKTSTVFPPVAYEHRDTIEEYAAKGYRYVDSIVTETDSHGCTKKLDLIFEIDAEG